MESVVQERVSEFTDEELTAAYDRGMKQIQEGNCVIVNLRDLTEENGGNAMNRCELAANYHSKGYNCCQCVLAAFTDVTGLDEQESMNLGAGFGAGAGTGELCGAISGAVMVLGLATPVNPADPVGSKKRTMGLSRELQAKFRDTFGALRCQDLLKRKYTPDDATPAAKAMGITNHCTIMIVTAVETVEAMLNNRVL